MPSPRQLTAKDLALAAQFDFCRISDSKKRAGFSPTTLRRFNQKGLRFYRKGRSVSFSMRELGDFLMRRNADRVARQAILAIID